jgi:hypothetical protein
MSALDRLSKIKDRHAFIDWLYEHNGYKNHVSDIKEVVALAKQNQQPSIDAMRFEAAKAAMQGLLASNTQDKYVVFVKNAVKVADALISELQKTKP